MVYHVHSDVVWSRAMTENLKYESKTPDHCA